jgi:hypothetical protein
VLLQSDAWDGLRFAIGAYDRDGNESDIKPTARNSTFFSIPSSAMIQEKGLATSANAFLLYSRRAYVADRCRIRNVGQACRSVISLGSPDEFLSTRLEAILGRPAQRHQALNHHALTGNIRAHVIHGERVSRRWPM